jgi:hypothetical protein
MRGGIFTDYRCATRQAFQVLACPFRENVVALGKRAQILGWKTSSAEQVQSDRQSPGGTVRCGDYKWIDHLSVKIVRHGPAAVPAPVTDRRQAGVRRCSADLPRPILEQFELYGVFRWPEMTINILIRPRWPHRAPRPTVSSMSINRIATLFPGGVYGERILDDPFTPGRSDKQWFSVGNRVRVHAGALKGLEGTVLAYCAASRLIVAVDLDCQGVTLEIDQQMLTLLDI